MVFALRFLFENADPILSQYNSVVIKKERIMPTGLLQIRMEKALQLPARPLPLFKEMSRPYVTKAVIPE